MHTAELYGYVQGWRQYTRVRRLREHRYQEDLRERLNAVVKCLVERYGASKIWLFGSLARREATRRSDVDLLVSGIPTQRWVDALSDACREMTICEVDLVPFEAARPEIRAAAMREGEVLYG